MNRTPQPPRRSPGGRLAAVPTRPRRALDAFLGVAADARTYRNLAYLLLSLPLGLAYFLALATGFALGTGLLVALVGLPVLVWVLLASRRLARFEHGLATRLLGLPTPAAAPAAGETWPGLRALIADPTARARLASRLADPATSRGLAFLVAKLPLGIVTVGALAVPYGVALALLLAPVTPPITNSAVGPVRIDTPAGALASTLLALAALVAAMHASNALAAASERVAHALLVPEDAPW